MRCTILAIGSRGDVQPMLTLGAGLRAAGVEVTCATHADFAASAGVLGLKAAVVLGDSARFFGGTVGQAMRDRAADPRALRRFFDGYLPVAYEKLLREISDVCRDTDAVICWPFGRCATSLAEALTIPVLIACPYPPVHLATAAFPNPFVRTGGDGSPAAVRRSWRLAFPALQMNDRAVNRWREHTLGLAPIGWRDDLRRLRKLPHLLGFSRAVVPRPADWAPWIEITGYWWLDTATDYEPPRELQAFLRRGAPPIAIGFSSQVGRDPEALTRTIIDAIGRAGVRAVIVTGFGGLTNVTLPEHILAVPTVPYDWLFRHVSAMVHQGGSGSTAAALRAGLPNVAVPFGFDQQFWGDRVHQLGAGPAPIPASSLSADALAAALHAMTTDIEMRDRAQALGTTLRSENGLARAVAAVVATLNSRTASHAAS